MLLGEVVGILYRNTCFGLAVGFGLCGVCDTQYLYYCVSFASLSSKAVDAQTITQCHRYFLESFGESWQRTPVLDEFRKEQPQLVLALKAHHFVYAMGKSIRMFTLSSSCVRLVLRLCVRGHLPFYLM